jgi:hypothetical protein
MEAVAAARAVVFAAAALGAALTAVSGARAEDRPPRPVEEWLIQSICASADGKRAAVVVEWNRELRVRVIEDGRAEEKGFAPPMARVTDVGFADRGRSLVVSGNRNADFDQPFAPCTAVVRLSDGEDLCRSAADSPTAAFRGLSGRPLTASADGEALVESAEEGSLVELLRSDTAEPAASIRVAEPIHSVAFLDACRDLFVLLKDSRFARVARDDGRIVWHAEPPHEGDDTTWLPGERAPTAGRPGVLIRCALVTDDGTRVIVAMDEYRPSSRWKQRIVVAYDWKEGKEVWRRRPTDGDMDEVFFIPSRSFTAIAHGRTAVVYRHADGQRVGMLPLEGKVGCAVFGRESDVGWGASMFGGVFRIDLNDLKSD